MRRLLTISYTKANIGALIERLNERKQCAISIRGILTNQRDQCFTEAVENPNQSTRVYGEVDKAVKSYVNKELHYVTFKRYKLFYNTYMRLIDVIMGVFDKVGLKPTRRNHFDVVIDIDKKRNRDRHELYRGETAFNYLEVNKQQDIRTGIVYWVVNLDQYGGYLQRLLEETNSIEDKLDAAEAMLDLFIDHANSAKELLDHDDEKDAIHFPADPLNRCLDDIITLRNLLISSEDQ
tara:strand:+ start:219 stop:926 length:708 start_codon:yes stop_codon:yes gene_type:complete